MQSVNTNQEQERPIQRIAVYSFAGNSGCSAIARLLVAPVFPNASLIELGAGGGDLATLDADFANVAKRLPAADTDLVVTFSPYSTSELQVALQRHFMNGCFDMWLIPCALGNTPRLATDAINAIRWLVAQGCNPKSIFVLKTSINATTRNISHPSKMPPI